MFNDITLGAVGAALIAAIVSLIGLIISKEQKISDFRQAWIDALRTEIITYLTSINAIADAISVPYKDQSEKVTALSPLYSRLNQSHFAITLRLNPKEKKSQAIIECMNAFNKIASNEEKMSPANFKPLEIQFLHAAKDLLKYEWKRVKRGEVTFIVTKWVAALVVVASMFSSVYYFVQQEPLATVTPAPATTPAAPLPATGSAPVN